PAGSFAARQEFSQGRPDSLSKLRSVLRFSLVWSMIGINVIRPLQRRLDENTLLMVVGIVVGAAMTVAAWLVFRKKCGYHLQNVPVLLIAPALLCAFTVYDTIVYFFISTDGPAMYSLPDLHNILMLVSSVIVFACTLTVSRCRLKNAFR
ncbi:MAG: hypothetical protein K6C36_08410, partial [Clostridia bacterium]|nr:hypothetical protein [Clostridia bacterium]